MHEARNRRVRVFATRIAHFPRRNVSFFNARDNLPANRTILIARINEIEKIRRDRQRELFIREQRSRVFLGSQRGKELLQLRECRDSVLQLPTPIIPIGVTDIAPKAFARGSEFFQGIKFCGVGFILRRRGLKSVPLHFPHYKIDRNCVKQGKDPT